MSVRRSSTRDRPGTHEIPGLAVRDPIGPQAKGVSFAQIADILERSFETGDSVLTSTEALHAGLFQR